MTNSNRLNSLTRTHILQYNATSSIRRPPTCEDIRYFIWNIRHIDLSRCVRRLEIRTQIGGLTEERVGKSITESSGETVRTWFVLSPSLLHPHVPPTAVVRLISQNPFTNEMFETTTTNYCLVIPTYIYFPYNEQEHHPATR